MSIRPRTITSVLGAVVIFVGVLLGRPDPFAVLGGTVIGAGFGISALRRGKA